MLQKRTSAAKSALVLDRLGYGFSRALTETDPWQLGEMKVGALRRQAG